MTHSIESIRRRPGMYVGDVRDGSGRLQLLWELVANALDLHLAGECDVIRIMLEADGAFVVEDEGPGMRMDDVDGVPFAQRALTRFHDTPTLDGHAPHEHLGESGVGLFPVCALSSRLDLSIHRDGRRFAQGYVRGLPDGPLLDAGPATQRGTRIRVHPDPDIFGESPVDAEAIASRLRELACLFPGLRLFLVDGGERLFHAPDGLAALLRDVQGLDGAQPIVGPFDCSGTHGEIRVDATMMWCNRTDRRIESFANVCRTTEGGSHVDGLMRGLVCGARSLDDPSASGHGSHALERALGRGLRAVVRVRLRDPAYARPTRERLASPDAAAAVAACVAPAFRRWIACEADARRHLVALLS